MRSFRVYCPNCKDLLNIQKGDIVEINCKKCGIYYIVDDSYCQKPEIIMKKQTNKKFEFTLSDNFIFILACIIALPVFIFLHKILPDPSWILNLDRILILIGVVILFILIFKIFKKIILILFGIIFILLSYGSIANHYGFVNLYNDYRNLIYIIIDDPNAKEIILTKLKPYKNYEIVEKAINYEHPDVRNFALNATVQHFNEYSQKTEYRNLIQSFAIFKEINSKWNYVNDPESRNYFAKASESVQHLSGDCDDHSILMVASIKAIGGKARIIHTTGHMYPEVMIGKKRDLETINYLIKRKLFIAESKGKSLNYHIDNQNQVWLNLDYTAKYPGGPFMDEEILSIIIN